MSYLRPVRFGCFMAYVFWFLMFSPWTSARGYFWELMLLATAQLVILSLISGKSDIKILYKFKLKYVLTGTASAILLYLIFWIGNEAFGWLFDSSSSFVEDLYGIKNGSNPALIALALLFWIGPAEEIFWRGFVQHRLSRKYSQTKALLITTTLYCLVSIWSLNPLLIIATAAGGLFWGGMFIKYKNMWPLIISHAVWDVLIFIIIPLKY